MDTIAPKTPATLPFAAWQAMSPGEAAREVHIRIAALPAALRQAAVAWLKPERDLTAELGHSNPTTDSPLSGLPYLLKDLFDLAGAPTKAGSTFLDKVRETPTQDAHFVTRLRELGATCAGKTHLVEFASGLTGENPHYGDCPHPHHPDRLSGGSSSGSAALVAAGVVPLAVGTDTGGSVRVPASWCGLYGFRLTPKDALIADAFPLAPTMDTAGWFTANAADMLTAWRALVSSSHRESAGNASGLTTTATFRGCFLPLSALLANADQETAQACDTAAAKLCPSADATTQAELLESWRDAVEAYVTIGMSEAHAVHRDWLAPYREHYDPVIWQRFTDAGHFPAQQIIRARAILESVRLAFRKFFEAYDFLVLPAVPRPAPRKADCTPELRRNILALTAPASLGGLPLMTVPVPLPSGLTAGLQIVLPRTDSPVVPWVLSR
jgi:amidase/aspartyl-tRNA(Asn)/glutamyl-tRNA(Gln) amidotransferase subunit A